MPKKTKEGNVTIYQNSYQQGGKPAKMSGPSYATVAEAEAAGLREVSYDAGHNLYYETRGRNETDFVEEINFPEEVFENLENLKEFIPEAANLEFTPIEVNPLELARKSFAYNTAIFPLLAGMGTAVGKRQAEAINKLQFAEFDKYMEQLAPGIGATMDMETEQIQSFLTGQLPADVREVVRIQSAQTANAQGVGAGGRAANIQARDLGITSTELVQFGLQAADAQISRQSQVVGNIMAPTAQLVANNTNAMVNANMVTPNLMVQSDLETKKFNSTMGMETERFNYGTQWDVYNANAQIVGAQNNMVLTQSEWDFTNRQNQADAAYNMWNRQRQENDSGGFGSILGSVVGAVGGAFIGQPVLGATIGGAVGGGMDNGMMGAAQGGIQGLGIGGAATMLGNQVSNGIQNNWSSFWSGGDRVVNQTTANLQNMNGLYPGMGPDPLVWGQMSNQVTPATTRQSMYWNTPPAR